MAAGGDPAPPGALRRHLSQQTARKVLRDLANRLRFGAAAPQSDEALWIDPRAVRDVYLPSPPAAPRFRRRHSGLVRGGDWDLSRAPLDSLPKITACRRHFEAGLPWEETGIYDPMLDKIARTGRADGFTSAEALLARYAGMDRLFAQLARDGRLRERRELPDHLRREHGGILIHIDRDGLPLLGGGGMHRLAMTQILGFARIPVQVGIVHLRAVRDRRLAALRKPG